MERKQNTLCRLHTLRAIQIGSCIVCQSSSPICETKGCIKHHMESQKMHTSYTVKDIQKITDQYVNSNQQKREILKKMVTEFFQLLKSQVQSLYHQISHTVDNLRFQNFLLQDRERKLADLLVNKRYSELTCANVAQIIPKMLKCASFQEKQFNHLKDFLFSQKQNLPKTVNSMILNLPYFRDNESIIAIQKFTDISDELLSKVNDKLQALSFRPKKLRIRYSNSPLIKLMMTYIFIDQGAIALKQLFFYQGERFIKLLEHSRNLKQIEVLQFSCTWNINQEDFQIQFLDAVLSLPFLNALTITTGYRVTSTEFIEEMVENKNIQLKIIKKEWHF